MPAFNPPQSPGFPGNRSQFPQQKNPGGSVFWHGGGIIDIAVEPDWFAEVELHADLLQRVENLMGSGFFAVVADDGIV